LWEHDRDQPPAESPAATPASPQQQRPRRRAPGERFSAPAACLDGQGLYLADGTVLDWPEVTHLGDLALLTSPDRLRLGWGGGEDRLPDLGQIWLYTSALQQLGLPTDMSLPADKPLTRAQRAKETRTMFARLDDHRLVAGALDAGWQ